MTKLVETKYSTWIFTIIMIGFTYFMFESDTTKLEIKEHKQRQEFLIKNELEQISTVFFNTKETLSTYDFPVTGKTKEYYMDSLRKDYLSLHSHTNTLRYLTAGNDNFNVHFEDYSLKIEDTLKGLRGYFYTEEEVDTAINALTLASKDLYRITDDREFSIENKQGQKKVLEVMSNLEESLSSLDKY